MSILLYLRFAEWKDWDTVDQALFLLAFVVLAMLDVSIFSFAIWFIKAF